MPKQAMSIFHVKTKLKPQATGQKREIKIFNWVTLNAIPFMRFKYMGDIWLTPFSSFIIYRNGQLWAYNKLVKSNIYGCFPSVKTKETKKKLNKIEVANFYQIKSNLSE